MDDDLRQALQTAPLLRLVALAGHVTEQRWNRALCDQHGLSATGVNTLLNLAWGNRPGDRLGRVTHAELARRLWIRPATLTGVVDTLERAGYVRRERDGSDRRVVWLVLTDAGWSTATVIASDVHRQLDQPRLPRNPAHEPVVRAFLIDLIITLGLPEDADARATRR